MFATRLLALSLALAAVPAGAALARQEKEPDILGRVKAVKGPFTMLVHLQVKKGEEKTLLEAARPCVAATRREAGCASYELLQDREDPTKFVFLERWKSGKALETHLGAPHTKKLLETLGKVIDGTPKFTFYRQSDER